MSTCRHVSDGGALKPLVASAHALRLFRALPNGEGRAYTATTFPRDPWRGCERFLRMCRHVGWITPDSRCDGYAVLDVLDVDGDIVQDFTVLDPQAFQQIKRRLGAVVEAA
jgi:hypothetical protein